MLTLEVIEREIDNIVQHGTNYEDCARLANLYICRAGLTGAPITVVESGQAKAAPEIDDSCSAFLHAVSRVPSQKCWAVIDELMSVLQATNPRLFNGVMRKLDE